MEIWKDIKGYEGLYQISNKGRVKSLDRFVYRNGRPFSHKRETIFTPCNDGHGYLHIILRKSNKAKSFKIHRLVAMNFIDNPKRYKYVNHKDGNKFNNDINNLEWCTFSYNMKHAHKTGIKKALKGESVHFAKLNNQLVKLIKNSPTIPGVEFSRIVGVDDSTISKIRRGKIWAHI